MMNGRGKSDSAIVAGKPTNKAGQPAAESVEPSAEAEGNAGQQSTRRAQDRESVTQALERIRQVARQRKKERFTSLFHHISVELTPGGILRPQARCRTGCGWADMAGLRGRSYHAVPTNIWSLGTFRSRIIDLWRRSLRRRSQKDGTTWRRITKLANDFLPRARILHPWPQERFAVKYPRWEPSARMGPARFCAGGAQ